MNKPIQAVAEWRIEAVLMVVPVLVYRHGWTWDIMDLWGKGDGANEQRETLRFLLKIDELAQEMVQRNDNANVKCFLQQFSAGMERNLVAGAIALYAEHHAQGQALR